MTLSSHAMAGAAIASFFPQNPIPAFALGFASHFVLDSIPHGHYSVKSHKHDPSDPLKDDMPINRQFFMDLMKIGLDFLLGFALPFLFLKFLGVPLTYTIFLGAFAGMLPDGLQFLYWKIRREPLTSLQRFHHWNHAKKNFNGRFFATVAVELSSMIFFLALVKILS